MQLFVADSCYALYVPHSSSSHVILVEVGQEANNVFGACHAELDETDEPGTEHNFGVQGS